MNNKICTFLVLGMLMNINANAAPQTDSMNASVTPQNTSSAAPISAFRETLKKELINDVERTGNTLSEKDASAFFDKLITERNHIDTTKKDFMSELKALLTQAGIEKKNIHGIINEFSEYLKSQTTFERARNICTLLFSCMSNCIDSMKNIVDEKRRGEAM